MPLPSPGPEEMEKYTRASERGPENTRTAGYLGWCVGTDPGAGGVLHSFSLTHTKTSLQLSQQVDNPGLSLPGQSQPRRAHHLEEAGARGGCTPASGYRAGETQPQRVWESEKYGCQFLPSLCAHALVIGGQPAPLKK